MRYLLAALIPLWFMFEVLYQMFLAPSVLEGLENCLDSDKESDANNS